MDTKEDRIAYYQKRLRFSKENYEKCKQYFRDKLMSDEESDQEIYCGYFKSMIKYWSDRLEKENQ